MSRDDLTAAIARDEVTLPGRAAIARYMLSQWYGKEL
jgi:NAD+ diphosphatase